MLLASIAILVLAGCGTATNTPTLQDDRTTISPTATSALVTTSTLAATPTAFLPTPTSSTGDNHFGVDLHSAYKMLNDLDIGLMQLNKHTDEMYSTQIPGGGIMVDIFGPISGVQAIETTFWLTPDVAAKIDPVVMTMLQIALGDDWRNGEAWVLRSLEKLSESHVKEQVKMGSPYLTLYFFADLEWVMFSVDVEKQ